MTPPFHFDVNCDQGLYKYIYIGGEYPIVAKNWPGLFEPWTTTRTPSTEFAVNNANKEEMAVYLGFVWQLCEEKPLYATSHFSPREAVKIDVVKWKYEVEVSEPGSATDNGFVPSTPDVGLFRVDTFRKLVSLHEATLSFAYSEVNLFSIPPRREMALVNFLNGEQRPTLADFLRPGELFVDIVVGVDYCYYDSILIKSVDNIENRLQDLVSQYTQAITDYERNIPNLTTMEEALQAMAKLTTGKLQRT